MEITNMWEGFNAKGNNSGYRGNTGSRDVIAGHVILKEKTVQEMTSGVRRAVHILQWGKKKTWNDDWKKIPTSTRRKRYIQIIIIFQKTLSRINWRKIWKI